MLKLLGWVYLNTRLILVRDKEFILLGGGTKKMQRKDIKKAQMLWAEYKKSNGK